jgi:hypothetical protein
MVNPVTYFPERRIYLIEEMETYLTFQKFPDRDSALELAGLLKEHGIEAVIADTSGGFEPTFANNPLAKEYRIKIKKENFEAANKLLLQISAEQIGNVDKDHYLFGFSDEELQEIVAKPDEWSQFDFLLAQKILKERGKEVKPENIEKIKKERLMELSKPDSNEAGWIIAGYIFAFLGGLLGIFIGHHLRYHKKTLPNGERVYAYSAGDRRNGYNIFIIGIVCFVFWTIVRIMTWRSRF